jgi:hypothetical protein
MGPQTFYGKRPRPLFCAGSRTAGGKMTISGIPNRKYYCVNFVLYAHFTNAAASRIIHRVRARVARPCCNQLISLSRFVIAGDQH